MVSCKSLTDGNSGDDEPQKALSLIASNDDLITQILLRLPVKSLLRFKSVSKRWFSLISNSRFIHNHNLRNPHSVSGFFFHRYSLCKNPKFEFISFDNKTTSAPFRFLTFVDDPTAIIIQKSCNGLLCFYSLNRKGFDRTYYIYNPSTNQYTTLPRPGGSKSLFYVNLAFDPRKSSHYKAVCVRYCDVPAQIYQIEIYSSETGQWRLSGKPFRASGDVDFGSGVFWNGALHWVNLTETSLCFNVDQECLRTMPMPPMPQGWNERSLMYFGESQGHLHLIEVYGIHTKRFDILEMESDYSSWFVKYTVDLDSLKITHPDIFRNPFDPLGLYFNGFSILCVVCGEDDADSVLVLHVPGKVLFYNLKDKTFKKLHHLPPRPRPGHHFIEIHWFNAFQFIETFSCV